MSYGLVFGNFFVRQASEQYFTLSQFLAQALRQVISRPQTVQGLLGRKLLLPRKGFMGPLQYSRSINTEHTRNHDNSVG
jgi:hypothetical protein